MNDRLKIGIIGSGNIGTDLLIKALRSPSLECTIFIGRSASSGGLKRARDLGVPVSDRSIDALVENPGICDLVFDATSAKDHRRHWPVFQSMGKTVIDMTPSNTGQMVVPVLNLDEAAGFKNMNMISCGGQASIPLADAIRKTHDEVAYIEIVSSIASKSAGPATRANIDEYIETTEKALRHFSGCHRTKAILILNPAQPPVSMQTTVYAKVGRPNISGLRELTRDLEQRIKQYVPGYEIVLPPVFENQRIAISVRVQGSGDYLPSYAGNLDIINCAAIRTAETLSQARRN